MSRNKTLVHVGASVRVSYHRHRKVMKVMMNKITPPHASRDNGEAQRTGICAGDLVPRQRQEAQEIKLPIPGELLGMTLLSRVSSSCLWRAFPTLSANTLFHLHSEKASF